MHLREIDGQTPEGGRLTLGKCEDLMSGRSTPGNVVIVDLTEATSKPSSAYREFMTEWASRLPPFHAAYVLPPVGAVTRMALRFVIGRMMAGHPSSTSSFHDTFDEALIEGKRFLATMKLNA